ncbi:MAG TPA: hypothetical protein VLF39_03140 [Candidatus Saccharimonadales bacterium]|nr:hypothetical protein [Candidatus Saccharimonadales bacterium]
MKKDKKTWPDLTKPSTIIRIIITLIIGVVIVWIISITSPLFSNYSIYCGNDFIAADPAAALTGLATLLPILYLVVMNVRKLFYNKNLTSELGPWYMKLWVQALALVLTVLIWFIVVEILFQHLFDGWCF